MTTPYEHGSLTRETARALARRGVVAALVLCVGLWGAVLLAQRGAASPAERDGRTVRDLRAAGCEYDTRADRGRTHVDAPRYTVEPPSGGDHLPRPAEAGVHAVAPPDGELVHALEHGLVVVWLGTGVDDAAVRPFAQTFREEVVVVRRPGVTGVAATAWHRRLHCPSFSEPALRAFVCAFRGRGPERPAPRRDVC
ncbi:MAG TPA: DUF3105 domain-containing protein [Frankiaceae bacterium]|nr:DUF3105 domain-containing protein [Frankiaceae bacterium]